MSRVVISDIFNEFQDYIQREQELREVKIYNLQFINKISV